MLATSSFLLAAGEGGGKSVRVTLWKPQENTLWTEQSAPFQPATLQANISASYAVVQLVSRVL